MIPGGLFRTLPRAGQITTTRLRIIHGRWMHMAEASQRPFWPLPWMGFFFYALDLEIPFFPGLGDLRLACRATATVSLELSSASVAGREHPESATSSLPCFTPALF